MKFLLLIISISIFLSGCGSDPGGDDLKDQKQTQTGNTLKNTIILYAAAKSSEMDMSEFGIHDKDTQAILRIIPDSDATELIATGKSGKNNSSIRPYTVDDNLFIIETNDSGHGVGKFNPVTNDKLLSFEVDRPLYESCFAVAGDKYYYTDDTENVLSVVDIVNGNKGPGTALTRSGDPDNCQGHLKASAGELYDAELHGELIRVYKRARTTGEMTTVLAEFDVDTDVYNSDFRIAVDGDIVYLALLKTGGSLSIKKNVMDSPDVYSGVIPEFTSLVKLDADNGNVALLGIDDDRKEVIILIDDSADHTQPVMISDIPCYDLEILYLESGV